MHYTFIYICASPNWKIFPINNLNVPINRIPSHQYIINYLSVIFLHSSADDELRDFYWMLMLLVIYYHQWWQCSQFYLCYTYVKLFAVIKKIATLLSITQQKYISFIRLP